MTDKPTAAQSPAAADNTTPEDSTLSFRRVIVWVVSLILALITSVVILQVVVVVIWPNNGAIPLNATFPISIVNVPLLPIMALPLTLFWVIWIDYFVRTRILND